MEISVGADHFGDKLWLFQLPDISNHMQGSYPPAQDISSPRYCIPIMEQAIQGGKISASTRFLLAELTKLDPWGSCSQCDGAALRLVGWLATQSFSY